MKTRRYALLLFLGVFVAASLAVIASPAAYAQQCYDPTGAPIPCPEKEKKPSKTPPRPTVTPSATETPTIAFVPQATAVVGTPTSLATETPTIPSDLLTAQACWDRVFLTAYATLTAGPRPENTAEYFADVSDCYPTPTDSYLPVLIPPTAGPVFLRPGVKNVLILVMIIGVLFTGGVLIARLGKK
ncbi:MAG TPA: hypothetical protein VGJ22_02145 [Anaerolineales bacterium]|jgi:hypothetical protein